MIVALEIEASVQNFQSFWYDRKPEIGQPLHWQILNLIFLRFVFQDKTSANWQEKITKMVNAEQPLDLKYTLYAGSHIFGLNYRSVQNKSQISIFLFLCSWTESLPTGIWFEPGQGCR